MNAQSTFLIHPLAETIGGSRALPSHRSTAESNTTGQHGEAFAPALRTAGKSVGKGLQPTRPKNGVFALEGIAK